MISNILLLFLYTVEYRRCENDINKKKMTPSDWIHSSFMKLNRNLFRVYNEDLSNLVSLRVLWGKNRCSSYVHWTVGSYWISGDIYWSSLTSYVDILLAKNLITCHLILISQLHLVTGPTSTTCKWWWFS